MTTSDNASKPPIAQTLTLFFDHSPTWGDLFWFVEQAKKSGAQVDETIVFEYSEDDPHAGPLGMSFFTHPDPAQLLDRG